MALAEADFEAYHGLVFATGTGKGAFWQTGTKVWLKSEQTAKVDPTLAYTIIDERPRTAKFSGTPHYVDKTGAQIVLADVQAAIQPDGVGSAKTPYFYDLQEFSGDKIIRQIHESDILDEAMMEAYTITQIPNMFTP